MNKKIKKAALSLMIAGTLLMGSGISVYAKTEESTETTEVTTEQKTTNENATTEAPKETPSKKDTNASEATTEDATNTDADKKESKGLGNWLYIIIFGVVAVVVIGVKMAGGKKGKPEASDDSMYGEKDETEEEESDYDEEDE